METLGRRSFLRGLVSVGAAGATVLGTRRATPALTAPSVPIYRLTPLRTHACNACTRHHRAKVFVSRVAADLNRAHIGCSCPITEERISPPDYRRLFPTPAAEATGIADRRHPRRRTTSPLQTPA